MEGFGGECALANSFICFDEEVRRREDRRLSFEGRRDQGDRSFVAVAPVAPVTSYKMPLKITKEMSSHLIKYVRTVNFSFNGESCSLTSSTLL